MKKRISLFAAITLIVLMVGLVMAARITVPDVAVVKGVAPAYSLYSPFPDGTYNTYRIYSVHVPFDQAVESIKRDPRIKGWKADPTLYYRAAFASPDDKQHIYISRAELLPLRPGQLVNTSTPDATTNSEDSDLEKTAPDPHGWVMITTEYTVNGFVGRIHRWSLALSNRLTAKGMHRFATFSVMPKEVGHGIDPVDTSKGSSQLEGKGEISGYLTMDD